MSQLKSDGLLLAFLMLYLSAENTCAFSWRHSFGSSSCRGPCSSGVALRMSDGSLQDVPFLKPQENFCSCRRGCPNIGGNRYRHHVLSWYVNMDNDYKFVAQNAYCYLKKSRRECERGETAVEILGTNMFAGEVLNVHCHCKNAQQILYQKQVARKAQGMYQALSCTQPSCPAGPANECARVYTRADDRLRVHYTCSCPNGSFCPMHMYDHLASPRVDEKGTTYLPAFCTKKDRDTNETS